MAVQKLFWIWADIQFNIQLKNLNILQLEVLSNVLVKHKTPTAAARIPSRGMIVIVINSKSLWNE